MDEFDLNKLKVPELKKKLKELGARITGTKQELIERYKLWKQNALNRNLLGEEQAPTAATSTWFPEDDAFIVPITELEKSELSKHFTEDHVHNWFEQRSAKKGRQNGRKLFLNLFVKNVCFVHHEGNYYIRAWCAAETRKHVDYVVKVAIGNNEDCFEGICQATCSCPAGTGWSAACKHVAALLYQVEHYSLTGENKAHNACTSKLQTWHHPPLPGRQVELTTVNDMLNKTIPEVETHYFPTSDDLLNMLIGHGLSTPIVQTRKANA